MVGIIEILIVLITILLCFKDLSYGLVAFFASRILIPETVRLPGGSISLNTAMIFVILLFSLVKATGKRSLFALNSKFGLGIAAFISYATFALLISDYGSLTDQFGSLIKFIITDLAPALILVFSIKTEKQLDRVIKGFVIISIICCVYGVVSVLLGKNYYIQFISNAFGADVFLRDTVSWSGIETSSTFVSTNSFGYFITLCIPFCVYLYSKGIYKKETKLAIILLLVNSILCKKRTAFLVVLFYLFMWFVSGNIKKRLKIVAFSAIPVVVLIVAIFTMPAFSALKSYIISSTFFWNDTIYRGMAGIQTGSTWELRTRQFLYPFTEINNNYLFGHGYGWCGWYLSKYNIHPIMFGFETILSQIVCDYGILGYIIYPLVMIKSARYASANKHIKNKYIIMYIIAAVLLMIGTGAVYWYLFLMMVIMMRFCELSKNGKRTELRSTVNNG